MSISSNIKQDSASNEKHLGFIQNLFWGRFRNDLIFPYPSTYSAVESGAQNALQQAQNALQQTLIHAIQKSPFQRSFSDLAPFHARIAQMSALTFAMDAMCGMTSALADRAENIALEVKTVEYGCAKMSWQVLNDAAQMGRDESFVSTMISQHKDTQLLDISNEGGKELIAYLVEVQNSMRWESQAKVGNNLKRIAPNLFRPNVLKKAIPLSIEMGGGFRKSAPLIESVHPSLHFYAERLRKYVAEHSFQFKKTVLKHHGRLESAFATQRRFAENAFYLFAMSCCLAKMDTQLKSKQSAEKTDTPYSLEWSEKFAQDQTAFSYFFNLAEVRIQQSLHGLKENTDASMQRAAETTIVYHVTLADTLLTKPSESPIEPSHSPITEFATAPNEAFNEGFNEAVGQVEESTDIELPPLLASASASETVADEVKMMPPPLPASVFVATIEDQEKDELPVFDDETFMYERSISRNGTSQSWTSILQPVQIEHETVASTISKVSAIQHDMLFATSDPVIDDTTEITQTEHAETTDEATTETADETPIEASNEPLKRSNFLHVEMLSIGKTR